MFEDMSQTKGTPFVSGTKSNSIPVVQQDTFISIKQYPQEGTSNTTTTAATAAASTSTTTNNNTDVTIIILPMNVSTNSSAFLIHIKRGIVIMCWHCVHIHSCVYWALTQVLPYTYHEQSHLHSSIHMRLQGLGSTQLEVECLHEDQKHIVNLPGW